MLPDDEDAIDGGFGAAQICVSARAATAPASYREECGYRKRVHLQTVNGECPHTPSAASSPPAIACSGDAGVSGGWDGL